MVVPKKLFKIGEIIQHTGLSRQTIHNYTVWGLIHEESRTDGNHRLYDESVFDVLDTIVNMKSSKTICQIRQYLEQQHHA